MLILMWNLISTGSIAGSDRSFDQNKATKKFMSPSKNTTFLVGRKTHNFDKESVDLTFLVSKWRYFGCQKGRFC